MYSNRFPSRLVRLLLCLTLGLTGLVPSAALGQQVPSQESFFGFEMGADRKLAR